MVQGLRFRVLGPPKLQTLSPESQFSRFPGPGRMPKSLGLFSSSRSGGGDGSSRRRRRGGGGGGGAVVVVVVDLCSHTP